MDFEYFPIELDQISAVIVKHFFLPTLVEINRVCGDKLMQTCYSLSHAQNDEIYNVVERISDEMMHGTIYKVRYDWHNHAKIRNGILPIIFLALEPCSPKL